MKSNRKGGSAGSAGRCERREFSAAFKAEVVRLLAERRAAPITPGARSPRGLLLAAP